MKRSIAIALIGVMIVAGLGVVTHSLDHGGKPADSICSFCASAAHGKAPPPAIHIGPQAATAIVWESTDPTWSPISLATLPPPPRAPPSEVSA